MTKISLFDLLTLWVDGNLLLDLVNQNGIIVNPSCKLTNTNIKYTYIAYLTCPLYFIVSIYKRYLEAVLTLHSAV